VNAKEIDRELNTGRPTAHATTESGSKRTRAAELHNLSEKDQREDEGVAEPDTQFQQD